MANGRQRRRAQQRAQQETPSEVVRAEIETPRPINVGLERSTRRATPEIIQLHLARQATELMSFNTYRDFIDLVLCDDESVRARLSEDLAEQLEGSGDDFKHRRPLYMDMDAYQMLKVATELYAEVVDGAESREAAYPP